MTVDIKKIKKDNYSNEQNVLIPPVDIYETENEFVITADMPAVTKDNVNIVFHDNKLEISGKIGDEEQKNDNLKYGEYTLYNYYRSFKTGDNLDSEKILASMNQGVLRITVPKKEKIKPKKIPISVS